MVGTSGFNIDEPSGQRWQLALELLTTPDAETVLYRGIGLWNARDRSGQPSPGAFTATVQSSRDIDWVTEATAREDLDRACATLTQLREASPEFDSVVGSRAIEYLLLDDYGMGAIHLAVLGPRGFEWLDGFKPR